VPEILDGPEILDNKVLVLSGLGAAWPSGLGAAWPSGLGAAWPSGRGAE